jgi:hypothetical protein
VLLVDGEAAGICKLAIRGDRGWIAGVGVAAPHRGRGHGETLMREAIRLYEKLGFATVRDVEVWALEGLVQGEHDVRAVPLAEAQARIARERREREPWQRADESVANTEGVEALESDRGAILFRRAGERISLLQDVAADADTARELLESLPAASSLHWLNGPEGDPFTAAIEALGGTRQWRQHEMLLRL